MALSVPLHHQTTGKMVKRRTVGLSHFPGCAEGPLCETEGIPERTKTMFKNTDYGCNVKTMLRNDRTMRTGKDYLGVLRRDTEAEVDEFLSRDPHYTFIETEPWTSKRNPRLFRGRYITITRRDDGTLRLNFRPMPVGVKVDNYAFKVYLELRKALIGLIEK